MNGKLGDIGFVELLKMVGKRTGRLTINAPNNQQYDWFIHEFRVFAVRINQESVKSIVKLQDTALLLINDETSIYSFVNREELDKFPIEMSFNLEQVIAESLNKLTVDAPCRQHFPNPETKFVASSNNKSSLLGDTDIFWQRAEYFLMRAASVAEISRELNLKMDYVKLEFYRLRVLGRISPVRVFSAGLNTRLQTPQTPPQMPPRLNTQYSPKPPQNPVNTAERNITYTPIPKQPETLPQQRIYYGGKTDPPPISTTDDKPKNEERKTLIRRMLGSLFGK